MGSKPENLYGKFTVHKDQVFLKPIVSMVGSPKHDLTKYLDQSINRTLRKPTYFDLRMIL